MAFKNSDEAAKKLGGMAVQQARNLPPGSVPYAFPYTVTVLGIIGLAAVKAELPPYAVLGGLSVVHAGFNWLIRKEK